LFGARARAGGGRQQRLRPSTVARARAAGVTGARGRARRAEAPQRGSMPGARTRARAPRTQRLCAQAPWARAAAAAPGGGGALATQLRAARRAHLHGQPEHREERSFGWAIDACRHSRHRSPPGLPAGAGATMSKCNVCWETLQGTANVAACGHCYCACWRRARAAARARACPRALLARARCGCLTSACRRLRAPLTSTPAGCEAGAAVRAGPVHACAASFDRLGSLALVYTPGETHAEDVLEKGDGCPLCGVSVSNNTLKVVPVEPQEAVVKARRARAILCQRRRSHIV
jgi:hypothetical protein